MQPTLPPQRIAEATALSGLNLAEEKFRKNLTYEAIPYAKGTRYVEIATSILPDRKSKVRTAEFAHPIFVVKSYFETTIGIARLCTRIFDYLKRISNDTDIDILSISAGMEDDLVVVVYLVRAYEKSRFLETPSGIYQFLNPQEHRKEPIIASLSDIDDTLIEYTDEEIEKHKHAVQVQKTAYDASSETMPFLNAIDNYYPLELPKYDEHKPRIYSLKTRERQASTKSDYEIFTKTFQETLTYMTSVERDNYYQVLRGRSKQADFMDVAETYIRRVYIEPGKFPEEDLPALIAKLQRALFDLYIIQDLIDDPALTDIKITAHDSIRVRINGKAYLSDVTFVDKADYKRFIDSLIIRNNIDPSVSSQTFTDDSDPNYILRFSLFAAYISSNNSPTLHIRKESRNKLGSDYLIDVGLMDEKIRDYLIDCGKNSSGVVFAGPPGSGKTILLNWFLEDAYEDSAEILVIQENDELFSSRKGIMFQHVVLNPPKGQKKTTLEDLSQMALVAGANVFVIGEAKGSEICSAITLSNSGCRSAITIHSPSAKATIDKMADLAMRGYAESFEQAKRMIKSFQTVVYLKDFKVQEIFEIVGYDEERKDMIYKPIYIRK